MSSRTHSLSRHNSIAQRGGGRKLLALVVAIAVAVPMNLANVSASAISAAGTPDASFNSKFAVGYMDEVTATLRDGNSFYAAGPGLFRKYNSLGVEDRSFGDNVGNFQNGNRVTSLALTSDRSIVVAGNFPGKLKKFSSTGVEDTGFRDAMVDKFTNTVTAVAVDSTDAIIVLSSFAPYGQLENNSVRKFTVTGGVYSEDTVFTSNVAGPPNSNEASHIRYRDLIEVVTIDPSDNAILFAGLDRRPGGDDEGTKVWKFNSDGTPALDFNPAAFGCSTDPEVPGSEDRFIKSCMGTGLSINSLLVLSNTWVLVGAAQGLARFNIDTGEVDTSFVDGAGVTGTQYWYSPIACGRGTILTLNTASQIIVGGGNCLSVLSTAGVLDQNFDGNFSPPQFYTFSGVVLADNSIILAGQDRPYLVKYSSSGILDTAFSQALIPVMPEFPAALATLSDGSLIAVGAFSHGGVKKFDSSGNEIAQFAAALASFNLGDSGPTSVAVLDDDSIVIGLEYQYGGLFKVDANGNPDTAFNRAMLGVAAFDEGGVLSVAIDLLDPAQQPGGSILVGGNFEGRLKKFSRTGQEDTAFSVAAARSLDTATTKSVLDIAVDDQNSPIVVSTRSTDGRGLHRFSRAGVEVVSYANNADDGFGMIGERARKAEGIGTLPGGVIVAFGSLPNARVQAFDQDGNEISSFATNIRRALPTQNTGVTALATLRDGTFLVCSNQDGARFLKRFTSAGIEIAEFTANVRDSISGGNGERIAIGPTGAITLGGEFRSPGFHLARFLGDSPGTTSPSSSSGGDSGSSSGGSGSGSSGSSGSTLPVTVRDPLAAVQIPPVTPGSSPSLPASGLAPGASVLLVGGAPSNVTIGPDTSSAQGNQSGAAIRPSGLVIEGSDFTMRLTGLDAVGSSLGLTSDAALILQPDNTSSVSGTGFRPGTDVQVYIFSTPRLLGTVSTDANGNFAGSVPIPRDLEFGRHTLQVNGYTTDGQVRSLSLGVVLQAPKLTSGQKVAKATVFFGPSSARLTSKARATLQTLARTVGSKARGGLVIGYVQRDQNLANDTALSTQRAKVIASHLRALGIKADLTTKGNGALSSKDKSRKATVSITYTGG